MRSITATFVQGELKFPLVLFPLYVLRITFYFFLFPLYVLRITFYFFFLFSPFTFYELRFTFFSPLDQSEHVF